jgi:pilus assembly protein Flp/PilA
MLGQLLKRFAADEDGTTAIEYALLGTIIAVALVASFSLVGDGVANMFGGGDDGAVRALDNAVSNL